MSKSVWILVLIFLVLAGGAWYWFAQGPHRVNELVYTNKQYGFEMTLPEIWRGYQVREEVAAAGEPQIASFKFGFPTADPSWGADFAAPVTILVYEPRVWENLQSEEGPKPGLIGQNEKYVFVFAPWQDIPSDLMGRGMPLSEEIVKGMFRALPVR